MCTLPRPRELLGSVLFSFQLITGDTENTETQLRRCRIKDSSSCWKTSETLRVSR